MRLSNFIRVAVSLINRSREKEKKKDARKTDFGIVGERRKGSIRGEINLSVYRLLVYAAIFSTSFSA